MKAKDLKEHHRDVLAYFVELIGLSDGLIQVERAGVLVTANLSEITEDERKAGLERLRARAADLGIGGIAAEFVRQCIQDYTVALS